MMTLCRKCACAMFDSEAECPVCGAPRRDLHAPDPAAQGEDARMVVAVLFGAAVIVIAIAMLAMP